MTEEKNKNIYAESKCERCGNVYPKFGVVENKKIKTQEYYPSCDCVVEIKLKKWEVPLLLGAAGMGEVFERIYEGVEATSEKGIDRCKEAISQFDYSWMWRKNVGLIIEKIKVQTGINLEHRVILMKDDIFQQ